MKAVALLLSVLLTCGMDARAASTPAAPLSAPSELTLVDCLQIAVNHNASLRKAAEQFIDARGKAIQLHAILYPTVGAQALLQPTTLFVQINQVLYSRATFPQLRLSRLAQDEAVANYQQTLADVIFQVRQAFFTALGAERGLALVQNFLSSQSHALSSAQQLFDAGKIDRSVVLNIQVTGNLVTQRENTSTLDVAKARFALDDLLGEELPQNARLIGDMPGPVPSELDPSKLTAEALRDRADLKLLQSLHLSEKEQILVDLKNAFPVIGAESNSAFQAPEVGPTSGFDLERNFNEPEIERQEGNSQLPLSLYANWLVFDGGNLAGVRVSDTARLETQQIALDSLKTSIPGEVAAAVAGIKSEQTILRDLDAQTPPAELRHAAELDYQAGRVRQLDLVNLESDLLGIQQLRLTAEVNLSLALAALDHALGRGLQTRIAPPAPPSR